MQHFIYNREGAVQALEISYDNFNKRVKKVRTLGYVPSKMIGGVEMFDINVLMKKKKPIKQKNILGYSLKILKVFKKGVLFE